MGRITKRFSARRGSKRAAGVATIDSGADVTVIQQPTACRLGLDVEAAPVRAVEVAGGGVVVGYDLPVRLRIGKKSAEVHSFVPAYRLSQRGVKEPIDGAGENLIGHDFLQAVKGRLNFETHDLEGSWPTPWRIRKATRVERALARRVFRCR